MSKLDEMIRELCPDGVEYVKLNSVCDIYDGTHSTPNYTESGVKFASVENIGNLYATRKYISEKDFEKYKIKPRIGDVMMTRIGSVGVCTVVDRNEALAFYVSLALLRPQLDKVQSRFLKYAIESIHGRKELRKRTLINAVPIKINKDDIGKVTIPLPPPEVQREIVRILDNFTNLTAELTAELTARQKQYEFYRDKLLTFGVLGGGTIDFRWRMLCEIADISTGNSNTNEAVEDGKYPFFVRSQEPLRKNDFEYDEAAIITAGDGVGVGKVYHYIEGKYALHQRAYRIHINTPEVVPKYYFHYMKAKFLPYIQKTMFQGSVASIRRPMLNAFPVPVPSLDVQNRIVNVLDNFEKICSDLNIGLPAEIEARQKQYEYYRDKLLTFVETGNTILSRAEQSRAEQSRAEQSRAEQSRAEQSRVLIKLMQYVFGYAVVSLQDVVKNSCSGGTPKKGVSEYYEDGNIPWLRTQEVVFRDICKTECFITESAVKNSAAKWIPENCVIVAISGATAGRCAINKIPLTTNQHCLNLEVDPEMALYRYVYYCICAKQEELLAKKEGARGDLNSTRILSLQIDLPSIEKQKRIVSILDRFDAICNDLTSGLPAEIGARQKQYEYYRDKLLTFKEVAAT